MEASAAAHHPAAALKVAWAAGHRRAALAVPAEAPAAGRVADQAAERRHDVC